LKIRVAKPAEDDLHLVESFIAEDNLGAAIRTVLRVLEGIEYLALHPTIGRPGRVPKTRELPISGTPFIVIYQVRGKEIIVLRILHGAQKWPRTSSSKPGRVRF
jgi:toxin ParE1/3/4